MSHLARGSILMGIDSQVNAVGRRHLGAHAWHKVVSEAAV